MVKAHSLELMDGPGFVLRCFTFWVVLLGFFAGAPLVCSVEPYLIEIRGDPFTDPVNVETDVGMVRANDTFIISWQLANRTDRVLVLGDLKASCPCLSMIAFSSQRLAPKEDATVSARWYVGPAHRKETLRVTIPLTAPDAPALTITIAATASVTDLVDLDQDAREVSLGKFTAAAMDATSIPEVTFRRTTFRAWDEVFVKSNKALVAIAVRESEAGRFALSLGPLVAEELKGRPFGVFSDDFVLGFRHQGRELQETVSYHVSGHFAHPTYALFPPQLYWGLVYRTNPPEVDRRLTKRVAAAGFTPTTILHQRTTYFYNGIESSDAASPFSLMPVNGGVEVRLAPDTVPLPKQCDKACSVYLLQGSGEGQPVRYVLPIFFSIFD